MQPEPSDAHEIACRLPRRDSTVPRARALLSAVLGSWSIDQEVLDTAELVLSELVTNALRARAPRDRQVGVRIAYTAEDGLLRLEVSDAGEGRPEVRNPGDDEAGGRGLLLVDALVHQWGVQERVGAIGKTVWAELKASGITAVPVERDVAAVTLQPGNLVKLRGVWRTVRSARGERSPSGGFVMVLGLDDGSVLRVDAAEPLTVRGSGQPRQCDAAGGGER
ncbi:ATP-binding protein [Streptomyces sp. NPDC046862]|uniref:ATP-binding protein n=1 Tax=Streptomyces sp. NPDC046862 TaxID=3154603 RepID=UPI003454451B